jgi:hypothetical protein
MKRRIVDHTWSREIEPVDALVLGCVDRRFKGWRRLFGEYMSFTMSFPLTIPGGVKDLVCPKDPRDTEHLLETIALLIQHYPNIKLVGMAHNGCLACGQCDDPNYYEDMLLKAGRLLQRRFPGQERFLVYLEFDGGISLVEEEVCVTA